MRVENAKTGMVLAKDLTDTAGKLLLEKGITLTEAYIHRLKQLGIPHVYVTDPYADSLRPPDVITASLRTELLHCFTYIFKATTEEFLQSEQRSVLLRRLTTATDSTITHLEQQMPQIMNCQVRQPSPDDSNHAINVCLLSVITGLYLKMPRPILRDLALGALLHDTGKNVIPLASDDNLPAGDLHTSLGYQFLLKAGVGKTVAGIAAQHHEHYDGTGVPNGLSGQAIHPLARLVAIANRYDRDVAQAMLDGTPLHEISERMMSAGNTLYDLNLLKAFFHTVVVYPVGSLVRLNTGQTGYVINNRMHFPLRPTIRLVNNQGQTAMDINLVYRPTLTITELIEA
ncbi:HD-GYP domain-containing protein [Propionispora vibrioides]|jgi:HD-GYP domain-containing protein (c-di-GMP phosphodiesterase class II)|uniref:HD domain-containing protein n=1 Tax=Propionispora vibrioides TaxID=112903 RepID=A0A1H8XC68_9FIRM|nr:HD domain-containing phosphohydrolase [Propionispora vibrioides]SEP37545.1 HD domain-containing protein [Propionispora vibrioides]